MNKDEKIKPIFKYIGGKSWLRDDLRKNIKEILSLNKNINTYIEPFSGGLGAFVNVYDILKEHKIENIILNDINPTIIGFYKNLKFNKDDIVERLLYIEKGFQEVIPKQAFLLDKKKDKKQLKSLLIPAKKYYEHIRDIFNGISECNVAKYSTLIFLQYHCFNGIYRENSKGLYNTPFNWEAKELKKDTIENKIDNIIKIFSNFKVVFKNVSFEEIEYNEGNVLYYLDPPYINEDKGENNYSKDGFDKNKQLLLINKIANSHFLYSNHNHSLLKNEFDKLLELKNLEINILSRRNIMTSKSENRGNLKEELLVRKKYI